jgi:hypothetical protein
MTASAVKSGAGFPTVAMVLMVLRAQNKKQEKVADHFHVPPINTHLFSLYNDEDTTQHFTAKDKPLLASFSLQDEIKGRKRVPGNGYLLR